jgi:ATP-dependent Lon protease
MYRIYAKGYDRKEKTVIARDYLLPKIRQEVNFNSNDILLSDEAIGHIIEKYAGQEAGVRNLKRYLEIIHTKLNLCRLMKAGTKMFDNNTVIPLSYPFNVTPEIINKLITQKDQTNNQFISTMYI